MFNVAQGCDWLIYNFECDLNNNFECDWLIELSGNSLSNNKLSNNNLAGELVETRIGIF